MRQVEIAQEECYCPVDVTVIPGAGHQPHREAPGATLDAIRNSQTRCCVSMTARRDGPRNAFLHPLRLPFLRRCPDDHATRSRRQSAAAAMGLCARRVREIHADYETLAQITALVPPRFGGYVPARHPALRYGLTLNDRGYFWEAQEILEAVWAAAPQGGRERILLRACILIATANLAFGRRVSRT
jgi:hypothetical protein